ncbi:unnamed protein product [Rotaria sp. Silwood2]|nr:unnamed protein product [Rotaria sp. Silwood2]CAF4056365.1 unnamed protein product [Rotaria sp. Silwood2]
MFYDTRLIPSNQIEEMMNSKTHLVSINVFWSMNLDEKRTAVCSTDNDSIMIPRYFKKVRFQINALENYGVEDANVQQKINYYYFQDENRILFPPGTIFKVEHCSKSNMDDDSYSIQLKLASLDIIVFEFGEIVNFWLNNEHLKTNQASLARLMMQTGRLDEAEKYYDKLLNKYFARYDSLKKYFYYGLGNVAYKRYDFRIARKYYIHALGTDNHEKNDEKNNTTMNVNKESQNVILTTIRSCDPLIDMSFLGDDGLFRARITYALANTYFSEKDETRIFKNHIEALRLFTQYHKKPSLDIVECYITIGKIYTISDVNRNHDNALKYFNDAVAELDKWASTFKYTRWRYLPFKIVPLLKNLGELFRHKHEFNKAYACQYTVLLIYQRFSIWKDFEVGSLYEDIGRIYQEDKKLKMALTFYHKAADIYYWCDNKTRNSYVVIRKLIEDNISQMK